MVVPSKEGGCPHQGKTKQKTSEINLIYSSYVFRNSFSTASASFSTQSKHALSTCGLFLPGLHSTVLSSPVLTKIHG